MKRSILVIRFHHFRRTQHRLHRSALSQRDDMPQCYYLLYDGRHTFNFFYQFCFPVLFWTENINVSWAISHILPVPLLDHVHIDWYVKWNNNVCDTMYDMRSCFYPYFLLKQFDAAQSKNASKLSTFSSKTRRVLIILSYTMIPVRSVKHRSCIWRHWRIVVRMLTEKYLHERGNQG